MHINRRDLCEEICFYFFQPTTLVFIYNSAMWFVYVLLCNDDSFYTGYTNNLEQRFTDHVNGKGGRYTRSHKPIRVIYTEQTSSKSDALRREMEIKSWTRNKKIKELGLQFE